MSRMLGLIGLCARAGRLKSGQDAVLAEIRAGRARLVLIDGGASQGTKKLFQDACAHYTVPIATLPEGQVGAAIGKPNRRIAVVTDPAFSEKILVLQTIDERGGALRE